MFGIRCASVCYVPYGDLANHTLLSHRRHPRHCLLALMRPIRVSLLRLRFVRDARTILQPRRLSPLASLSLSLSARWHLSSVSAKGGDADDDSCSHTHARPVVSEIWERGCRDAAASCNAVSIRSFDQMIRKKRGNCFDFFPLSFWLGERGTEIAPGEIMQCGICICPVKVSCAFQVLLHRPFPSFRLKSTKREKKLSARLCEIHQLEHRENVSCYRIIYALEQTEILARNN